MKKILYTLLILVFLVVSSAGMVGAQNWPEKDIRIIVPFSPGGAVDVTSRIFAEIANKHLDGVDLRVENKAGGGAVIGQTYVANAKADGYTILAYTSSVVNNPLTKETTYTHKSFQPIAMYMFDPEVLVVPAESELDDLDKFVEYAKENSVSLSTPGFSTSHHIAGLIFENSTGVKFNYLHNKGASEQVQQLMGNHVESALMALGEAQSQIQEGLIKPLGLMDANRREDFPEVPTFQEYGIDLSWGAFRGYAVPIDTPDEVVEQVVALFEKVIKDEEYISRMQKAGFPPSYRGPEQFETYVDGVAEELEVILPEISN